MAQNLSDVAQAARNQLHDKNDHSSWASIIENSEDWEGCPSEAEEVALDRVEAYAGIARLRHDRDLQAQNEGISGSKDLAKAQELQYKTLSAFQSLYDAGHHIVLTASHNLAFNLTLPSKFAESEKMYQRTLDGYEQIYGPDHELTVNICHCCGHVLASQWKGRV